MWINLPQQAKMTEPADQEFTADEVAPEVWPSGTHIRVIAGKTDRGTQGPVNNQYVNPTCIDVSLKAGDDLKQTLPVTDNAFIYPVTGELSINFQDHTIRP